MCMYVKYVRRNLAAVGGRYHSCIGVETTGDGCLNLSILIFSFIITLHKVLFLLIITLTY